MDIAGSNGVYVCKRASPSAVFRQPDTGSVCFLLPFEPPSFQAKCLCWLVAFLELADCNVQIAINKGLKAIAKYLR